MNNEQPYPQQLNGEEDETLHRHSGNPLRIVTCVWWTVAFFAFAALFSCKPSSKIDKLIYFKGGDSTRATIVNQAEPIILPGDRLSISVSSTVVAASAQPYNIATATTSGYLVESDGNIAFPQLGRMHVQGMTRRQLTDSLTNVLGKYLVDPIVTIQFLNFKVTMLGEVAHPGTLTIPEGKATLVEAIGLAGDLTTVARRDNVMVIREKDGKREFGMINMLSKDAFSSPYYVLQQGDVVYVEPAKEKLSSSDQTFVRTLAIVTSVLSAFSTIVFLVVQITK